MNGQTPTTKPKVAVLGPLGTYTHEAAYRRFGSSVEYQEQRTITDVFNALSPSVPLGVVPQENTIFGSVIETYDVLRKSNVGFVRGEATLGVQHCFLVRKGVKLQEVQSIMSHEQALGQCGAFISANLPSATLVKMPSTAAAARAVLESPLKCGAICSKLCATIFDGLEVLYEGVQDESVNFTRFYIIAKSWDIVIPPPLSMTTDGEAALIRLSTPSSTGAINILRYLAVLTLNVVRIDRRPSPEALPFHDVYFLELGGGGQESALALTRLVDCSWTSKVEREVGSIREAGGDANLVGIW